MASVTLEPDAADELASLPVRVRARVENILARLEEWPKVSGAKPLRGEMKGKYRVRTGDYRVVFRVEGDEVIVERIGHRDRFYEV